MWLVATLLDSVGGDGGDCPLKVVEPKHMGAGEDTDSSPSFCSEEIKPGRAGQCRESAGKQGGWAGSPPRLLFLTLHGAAAERSRLWECCPGGALRSHPIPRGCILEAA